MLALKRPEDAAMDMWTILNVVQEHIVRGGVRAFGSDGRQIGRMTRGITAVDKNREVNERLFQLALDKVA
jgi:hypothetical protein